MMSLSKKDGFSLLPVLLVIIVMMAIGFGAYRVFNSRKGDKAKVQQSSAEAIQETHARSSKQDLTESVDTLKTIDTNTQQDEALLGSL